MNTSCSRRIISVAGMLAALAWAAPAMALHTQSPPVTQVTSQTSGTIGMSTVWGDVVWAFQASGDSLGTGNTTPELFMYEHDVRMLGGAQGLSQITCGGFEPDNPSISTPSFGNVFAFDAVGTLCSDARHNCVPPFDASSTTRQIFAYYPDTGQIRQLTRCPGDCTNPSLSQNARMIAFESTSDVLGTNGGVPFPVTNVYQGNMRQLGPTCPMLPCPPGRADRAVKNLTPIGGGRNPSQNFSGKFVAFESDGDPLHNGANPGVPHIYVRDVKKNTLMQVPPGSTLPARNPSVDQGGRRVVYEIDVPRPGGSPAVVTEIWVSKLRANRDAKTMSLTTGATANSYHPSLGPTGRRVTFTSEADLLHRGSTGPQVFGYTFIGNGYNPKLLLQVTGGPSGSDMSVQSAFLFAGFSSSDDFVANGNTTPQFFVANLYKRAPGSVLSPFPGTPTPRPTATPRPIATPVVGIPNGIALALVTNQSINNNDNTLTTIIAATVVDFFGNPVPNGTLVNFSVPPPPNGIVIGNSLTNTDPDCDLTSFEQQTGVQIENRPGVAHVCVTYPGAFGGQSQTVIGESGPTRCVGGQDDGNACVEDADCDPTAKCSVHTTITCDLLNGNADCPLGEACQRQEGTCEHTARTQGPLVLPVPVNDCDANGQPCSDGNPCTLNDVCAGGTPGLACVGGTRAGLACTSVAQCPPDVVTPSPRCELVNPPTCQPGAPRTCANDGNACTVDTCNFLTGQCGTPKSCLDDGNPCTDDRCDTTTGNCGVPNVAPCTDHDVCTVGDECAGGACVPDPP